MREAKVHTSWTDPQRDYEESIRSFVRDLYKDEGFIQELDRFVEGLDIFGHLTSLAQTLIKLTAPGIPDFYQGAELWNFSLVDPDNRRPVDYDVRRRYCANCRNCRRRPSGNGAKKGCRNSGLSSKGCVFGMNGHRHLAIREAMFLSTPEGRNPRRS